MSKWGPQSCDRSTHCCVLSLLALQLQLVPDQHVFFLHAVGSNNLDFVNSLCHDHAVQTHAHPPVLPLTQANTEQKEEEEGKWATTKGMQYSARGRKLDYSRSAIGWMILPLIAWMALIILTYGLSYMLLSKALPRLNDVNGNSRVQAYSKYRSSCQQSGRVASCQADEAASDGHFMSLLHCHPTLQWLSICACLQPCACLQTYFSVALPCNIATDECP